MKTIKKIMVIAVIALYLVTAVFGTNTEMYENKVYEKGIEHENVKILQQALKVAGSFKEIETSDYYGDKTKAAVIHFQRIYNLEADGIAGSKTLDKISEFNYWPVLQMRIYKKGIEHKNINDEIQDVYGKYNEYFGSVYFSAKTF